MELRTTEESIQELVRLYESIRQSPNIWSDVAGSIADRLPRFVPKLATTPLVSLDAVGDGETKDGLIDDDTSKNGLGVAPTLASAAATDTSPIQMADSNPVVPVPDLATAVETLNRIQSTLVSLQPKMDRFRTRLAEKDPVTQKPRYGEKTQNRVQAMVHAHDFLIENIPRSTLEIPSDSSNSQQIFLELQQRYVHLQSSEQQAKEQEEREQLRRDEEARQEAARMAQLEAQRAKDAAERERRDRAAAEAELRRHAEMARQRRLAQEGAEQDWIDSISRGPEGVKTQLNVLKESTKDDLDSQAIAISSLHTIFQQINAHPEETNFRRIRRDHEKFTQDIGRHKGGVEVLIAAGFELGTIDDIPSYLSKEPNIESDMDGWYAWFDLLKATLEILEEEVTKLTKKARR